MLEPSHRPKPLLEVAVVSLQTIIQILRAAMLCAGENTTYSGRIARRFVGYDTLWHYACPGEIARSKNVCAAAALRRMLK
jgi:hypothetical protein